MSGKRSTPDTTIGTGKYNGAAAEIRSTAVDLTHYNFSNAPLYKTKPNSYQAYELKADETIVRSWGVQEMKKGDWIILKPSASAAEGFKKSGIKREAFLATYVADPQNPGNYSKESFIKAVRIDQPYQFIGIDSKTPEQAPAGSYLVLNLDKKKRPITVNGRRDIFFYTQRDLMNGYELA